MDISELKQYHSVCGMDISVSPLMNSALQKMNILLNLLYVATLGVNGVRIIPNLRSGDFETANILKASYGLPPFVSIGCIGTQRGRNAYYDHLFRCKCLLFYGTVILAYGTPNWETKLSIDECGLEMIVYKDYRQISYAGGFKNERR